MSFVVALRSRAAGRMASRTGRRMGPVLRGTGLVLTAMVVTAPLLVGALGSAAPTAACGPGGQVITRLPGPLVCAHPDVAPPGVDVTEPVSTEELRSRDGAGLAAYEAAQELGVPMAAAGNATTPGVR